MGKISIPFILLAGMLLMACTKELPTQEHVVMLEINSSNWGCNDSSYDYFCGSYWTVYYDGTVEFYNEYNLSGSTDNASWTLEQEELDKLYQLADGKFKRYKEDYDSASDGTGWYMIFYDETGEVEHQFDGYIGSIIFLVGLPPHSVLVSYATLDRMEKQCCSFITDGEELKNNLSFLRRSTQCSIVFPSHQGQVPSGWLLYTSGSAA